MFGALFQDLICKNSLQWIALDLKSDNRFDGFGEHNYRTLLSQRIIDDQFYE